MPKRKNASGKLSESTIQTSVINKYERTGWLVVKIIQTTMNGWPDLQCHKMGKTLFIECKEEGDNYDFETRYPLQHYRHEELRRQGFTVKIIDYLC